MTQHPAPLLYRLQSDRVELKYVSDYYERGKMPELQSDRVELKLVGNGGTFPARLRFNRTGWN